MKYLNDSLIIFFTIYTARKSLSLFYSTIAFLIIYTFSVTIDYYVRAIFCINNVLLLCIFNEYNIILLLFFKTFSYDYKYDQKQYDDLILYYELYL